jgi:hypothetical protein
MPNNRKVSSNAWLRLAHANPDVTVPTQPNEPKTPARRDLDAELKKNFAATFEANWRLCGGPELEKEFQFCPERKWRADYYIAAPVGNVLLELDGGVWTGGRHSRGGKGYIEDCMKLNSAAILGFYVIRIPTGFATPHYLRQIIEWLQG